MSKENPVIDLEGVGGRVRAVRLASGLTGKEFAATFGCDQSAYSKIERGEKGLSLALAVTLAERWSVSLDFIYRGDLSSLDPKVLRNIRSR